MIELNDFIYRVKKTILFFYLWFIKPMPDVSDYYYYYGIFDSWQKAVNPDWDDMDIYQQIDYFSKHWVYKR